MLHLDNRWISYRRHCHVVSWADDMEITSREALTYVIQYEPNQSVLCCFLAGFMCVWSCYCFKHIIRITNLNYFLRCRLITLIILIRTENHDLENVFIQFVLHIECHQSIHNEFMIEATVANVVSSLRPEKLIQRRMQHKGGQKSEKLTPSKSTQIKYTNTV